MKTIIAYGKQSINQSDIAAVVKILRSGYLTQGPEISKFEQKIAEYVGSKYAVVFNSGTAALHAAYFACDLGGGDEIITSAMTFAATSNAALYLGASVVFSDITDVGNIDPELIEEKITKKTKLITPIHYAGNPADMAKIKKIAEKYHIKIVEDACHALGAEYHGNKIGSCEFSDATVFSFHPVKHITTGEGGCVTTNNENIYKKLLQFRTHGITKNPDEFINDTVGPWYHEMNSLGFNYRLTDFQAALGRSQLSRIDTFVKKRRKIAKRYDVAFENNLYFTVPIDKQRSLHSYHLYPIILNDTYVEKRNEIFLKLKEAQILVQVHYIPVYFHPYYQNLGFKRGLCPKAESFYRCEISLPIFYDLTVKQQDYVIKTLFKVFEEIS